MTAEAVDAGAANARISRAIKGLIAIRGTNVKALAADTGMSEDTLGRRLKNEIPWKVEEILAIAGVFQVSVSVLLESDPDDWFRRDPAEPPIPVVTLRKKPAPKRPEKARTRRNSVYNSVPSRLVAA